MKKIRLYIALYALSTSILSGCHTVRTDDQVQRSLVNDSHPRAQLVLGHRSLLDHVIYRDVKFGQVGQFPRAQFQLENRSDQRINLEYSIRWHDEAGFEISDNQVWHRFVLGPRQVKTIKTLGKTDTAHKIQVIVRYPDDLFIETNKQLRKTQ